MQLIRLVRVAANKVLEKYVVAPQDGIGSIVRPIVMIVYNPESGFVSLRVEPGMVRNEADGIVAYDEDGRVRFKIMK